MRWIVATSLKFRYLVMGLAVVLMYFGIQTIGHQKLDVFPEFAPVSVEIQTGASACRRPRSSSSPRSRSRPRSKASPA